MGLVYNGVFSWYANTGMVVTFNTPVSGVGTWFGDNSIQDDFIGTVTLFDSANNVLGSYGVEHPSLNNTNYASIFVGAFSTTPVYKAQFDIQDLGDPRHEDFAIGTMSLSPVPATTVPEPGSLLLLVSALGIAGRLISRRKPI